MKRQAWSDIKAGIQPEIRTRLEAEGVRLCEHLRDLADSERQTPRRLNDGRSVPHDPGRDYDEPGNGAALSFS